MLLGFSKKVITSRSQCVELIAVEGHHGVGMGYPKFICNVLCLGIFEV